MSVLDGGRLLLRFLDGRCRVTEPKCQVALVRRQSKLPGQGSLSWNRKLDVADWLRSLGLSQYEAAFRDSEIDADVLPELSEQHLKDLGVSLGHRLKMMRSVTVLLLPPIWIG
jgi:hypothetical protein